MASTPASNSTKPPAKTSWLFKLISAVGAFGIWGGWAYVVNSQAVADASASAANGHASPLTSALIQGTGSFCVTIAMVAAVSWLYQKFSKTIWQIILPGVITVSITGTGFALVHNLVGTANVLQTIAPALTVAFSFCLFVTLKLRRIDNLASRSETEAA